jgi:hypothetical protein
VNLLKHLLLPLCTLLSISNPGTLLTKQEPPFQENIPVATRWLLDAAGGSVRASISSVYQIRFPKRSTRGTGFLLKGGPMVTAEHVIRGHQASEIIAISPSDEKIMFSDIIADPKRDLALLFPSKKLSGGLLLGADENPLVGVIVSTWGFPDGWCGHDPLLSVGYLSGYIEPKKDRSCESFI